MKYYKIIKTKCPRCKSNKAEVIGIFNKEKMLISTFGISCPNCGYAKKAEKGIDNGVGLPTRWSFAIKN
jgi:rubredoxin